MIVVIGIATLVVITVAAPRLGPQFVITEVNEENIRSRGEVVSTTVQDDVVKFPLVMGAQVVDKIVVTPPPIVVTLSEKDVVTTWVVISPY